MLGFLFWQHSKPVATERYGEMCEVWLLDIECFQKGREGEGGALRSWMMTTRPVICRLRLSGVFRPIA